MTTETPPESAPSVKQQARAMIEQFPDDVTWDDLVHEFKFAAAVTVGLAAADRGEFASEEEVAAMFAKYGVKT